MFWELAPCELSREIEAASLIRKDEATRDLVLAWTTAALSAQAQVGKLKDLNTLVASSEPRSKRQEQRQILHFLSERYRIPLRTKH